MAAATQEAQDLAYEHVTRALEQQADVLQSIWARTATLIAVTSLVATFLGARALDQPVSHTWVNYIAILPLAAFGLGLLFCIRVLLPTARDDEPDDDPPDRRKVRGLRFTLDANRVLDTAAKLTADDEPLKVKAARNLQANWESNRAFLDTKFAAFTCACLALGAQVVFWGLLLVAKEVM